MRLTFPVYVLINEKRKHPNIILSGSSRASWRVPVFTTPEKAQDYTRKPEILKDKTLAPAISQITTEADFTNILKLIVEKAKWAKWVLVDPSPHPRAPKRKNSIAIDAILNPAGRRHGH